MVALILGAPPTGDLAHNPGMALTGNPTGDPLVCRPALNPLSHTSQGYCDISKVCYPRCKKTMDRLTPGRD